ncbi:hypothetical protein AQUCO_02000500v1 [Aquilegia coerulea]|uniref:COP1-interacting protein 7 n=1 Tax=Aquilegia coerulea TaxID=218851 RepID=A0A2G5DHV4_AQUCA|nr:hypothetical protein AQUCO_02000500v1 [Aquilegia coerulea]
MRSDTALDYAVFQLSPKRSRCELFVSGDGNIEKLASGLLKPFVAHLTVAEEQVAKKVPSIKLEVNKRKNEGTWFTKGTLERFVRFVSTPEVLELVITFDAEMSQLEAARRIYLQGAGNQLSSDTGGDGTGASTSADITKKELLRAIDVRLVAVRQDLTTACARASAAGFTVDTVSELQLFAERFGAHRLSEACAKFMSLSQKRPDLVNPWKLQVDDRAVRSSSESDMSIDDPNEENITIGANVPHQFQQQLQNQYQHHQQSEQQTSQDQDASQHQPSTSEQADSSITFPRQHSLREPSSKKDEGKITDGPPIEKKDVDALLEPPRLSHPARRLSVQDRINLFENKQKEQGTGSGSKVVVTKSVELRRLSSDVSSSGQAVEKAVLRRWSGASDMSMDLSSEKKDTESSASTPCSTSNSLNQTSIYPSASVAKDSKVLKDTATSSMSKVTVLSGPGEDSQLKDQYFSQTNIEDFSGKEDTIGLRNQIGSEMLSRAFSGRSDGVGSKDITNFKTESRVSFDSSEGDGLKDQPPTQHQLKTSSVQLEEDRWKSQVPAETRIQSKNSLDRTKDIDLIEQAVSQSSFRSFPRESEQVLKGQAVYQPLYKTSSDVSESVGTKDHISALANFGPPLVKTANVGSNERTASKIQSKASISKTDDVISLDQISQVPFNAFPGSVSENVKFKPQPGNLLKASLTTVVDSGVTSEDDALTLQSQWNSFPGKSEDVVKKDAVFPRLQGGGHPSRVEGSSRQEIKLKRQSSGSEKRHNLPGRRGETTVNGNQPDLHGKVNASSEMSDCISTAAVEQVQKTRLSKGNQELNEELQNKANDLEKLFAAHKLRVPGDQSATGRRSKPIEVQAEQVGDAVFRKQMEVIPLQIPKKPSMREPLGTSNDVLDSNPNLPMRMIDNQDHCNIAEVGYPEEARGKLYDSYMRKREAKLREEWSSNRGQKEAKMKAMQDYLESSSAEMKAKFSGSADRHDSVLNAFRRAEKLRSFNIRSAMKNREQHPIGSLMSEEDEDLSEHTRERSFGETIPGEDGSAKSILSKRLSSNRTTYSSTPRTSAALFSRSSARPSYMNSERRRSHQENPLAQSVPDFSDLRKENTRPSPGISKLTTRSQPRSTRSKSISEDLPLVKEEKPRRSQSMRKNSAGPPEMKDLSSPNSEGIVLTQLKFDKEQAEQCLYNKVLKNGESKPFLRKGNGIRPGAGAGIAKLKASMASENLKTEEDVDELEDQFEDSVDMILGEEEDSEAVFDDESRAAEYPTDSDNEKPGISKESVRSGDPELGNGELLRSFGSANPDSVDEVAAAEPSMFHTAVEPVQDSPGESPASWNSRGHHPFSYAQETSDIDAFAESPMGSPASWNSHSHNQIEADAARMRKKWGSAQKTILVSNTSNHQTRKDVTKGFKRLLKFGRKSRGTESLVDWISATTSEGDDDTEDGCDLSNRSSEDLRKSRMGFSQDGFNDGDLFNEQVQALRSSIPTPPANFKLREEHLSGSSLKAPRSFFSLSSFRSKGSESKPR